MHFRMSRSQSACAVSASMIDTTPKSHGPPCKLAQYYGYLLWLNHERRVFPSVPASSYFAIGAGSSFMWIEPERRLAAIVRWLNPVHADAFFGKVLEALEGVR
jgi:CubicO group peptidase (beta-lactamase class C family)